MNLTAAHNSPVEANDLVCLHDFDFCTQGREASWTWVIKSLAALTRRVRLLRGEGVG